MPGLKDLFFPSSSRSTLKKHGSRRLTRQRKIRHVTDRRMGLSLSGRSSTAPPTPQPLPLPEFRRERERERGSDQFSQRSKGDGDGRNESIDTRASSLPSETSSLSPRLVTKTTNNLTINSEKPPTYFHSGFPLSPDDEIDNHNFRLNIPARSAPPSGLSSPVRNPQRFNSVDFAPSIPQFLFSSNTKENISNNSGRRTPDSSPLHSPKQKSIFKSTNNHDLHPLPLPPPSPKRTQSPPSPKPIQSPTNINISEKNEGSSKSQWVKGKLIGRGTYGTVFEAFNSATGAMCAMKEVDIMLDDPKSLECIKQLEQEIKILQQLEHKNIVRYYGCEVVEDHFCIYLEYVYPGSISKYIREHFGAITESVVRNFTRHILSGLAYLHSTDTVHRDIKGANLLLDASGVVKLADFGLAKHLTAATYDLSLKGSPHWMAPELLQAVMRKDSDHQHAYAIDIWSLGCTVIEMFNGKPPWSECTGVQALFHVMNKSPEIPESLSPEGKDFLNRCFKRNPADRPSAAQLLKHPFVRNTEQEGLSSCILEFSRLKLAGSPNSQSDVSFSPREWPKSLPTSPRALIRQVPRNSERSKCESARAAPNRSPCSTLEALPSISSPDFNNSPTINSYKSAPNNLRFATGYNYQNINRKARKGFSYSFEGL